MFGLHCDSEGTFHDLGEKTDGWQHSLSKSDYLCVGTDRDAGELNIHDWIILRVQSSAGRIVLIFLNSFTKYFPMKERNDLSSKRTGNLGPIFI